MSLLCPNCANGTPLGPWPEQPPNPYRAPSQAATVQVQACRVCAGVWVDRDTFEVLLRDAAQAAAQSSGEVRRQTLPPGLATGRVVYRACPQCRQSMVRKNFASVSGVVLDVCGHHGTFFEYGELLAVLDFVRSGGLRLAEEYAQAEDARDAKHRTTTAPAMVFSEDPYGLQARRNADARTLEVVRSVSRFVRNMFR
jgi:Zn-finger nucleic acid-binding protein